MTLTLMLTLFSLLLSHVSCVYLYVLTKKYDFSFSKSLLPLCLLIELYQFFTFLMNGIQSSSAVSIIILSRESLFFLFGISTLFIAYRFLRKNIDVLYVIFSLLALFSISIVIGTTTLISGFSNMNNIIHIIRTTLYFHVVFFVVVIPIIISLFLLLRGRLTVSEVIRKEIYTNVSFGIMSALVLFFIVEFLLPLFYSPIHYLGCISLSILPLYCVYTVVKIKEEGINKQITANFLFDHISDAVIIYDHGYHIVEYNASVSKFYPGKKQNLIGEHILQVIDIGNHRYDEPCLNKEVVAVINNVSLSVVVTQHFIKDKSKHNGYLMLINCK